MVSKPKKFEIAQSFLTQMQKGAPIRVLEIGATDVTDGIIKEVIGGGEHYKLNIERSHLGSKPDSIVGDGTRMPFADGSFDVVLCFDMIVHLIEPDDMILEAQRVLKKGGVLVISTINLANIYNRILLMLGFSPLGYSPTRYRVGLPYPPARSDLGHKSIFTYKALRDLLKLHDFEIVKSVGYCYYEPFYKHQRTEVGFFRFRVMMNKILPKEMREGMIFFAKKR